MFIILVIENKAQYQCNIYIYINIKHSKVNEKDPVYASTYFKLLQNIFSVENICFIKHFRMNRSEQRIPSISYRLKYYALL